MTRMTSDQRQLAATELELVERIARKLIRGLPASIEVDDLISAGNVGLVRAAQTWQPHRGVPFACWARVKITSAIRDSIRRGNYTEATHLELDEQHDQPTTVDLDEHRDQKRRAELVQRCIDQLSPESRTIILARFWDGGSIKAIAIMHGEREHAIQSRHRAALDEMRELLRREGLEAA